MQIQIYVILLMCTAHLTNLKEWGSARKRPTTEAAPNHCVKGSPLRPPICKYGARLQLSFKISTKA